MAEAHRAQERGGRLNTLIERAEQGQVIFSREAYQMMPDLEHDLFGLLRLESVLAALRPEGSTQPTLAPVVRIGMEAADQDKPNFMTPVIRNRRPRKTRIVPPTLSSVVPRSSTRFVNGMLRSFPFLATRQGPLRLHPLGFKCRRWARYRGPPLAGYTAFTCSVSTESSFLGLQPQMEPHTTVRPQPLIGSRRILTQPETESSQ